MTIANVDRRLTLDFSVPANSHAPNPKLADKLQKLAAAMDITIESKLNPSIGQQNITARRSRIAALMRQDGQRLQLIQSWLIGLAARQPDLIGERVDALRRKAIYQQVPDFFPTPGEIVARMLQLATVQPHHRCLDPEGGAGDICLALRDLGVKHIDCFELNAGLVEALTLLGFPPLGRDFLTATPRPIYERILMNPPFSKDVHIQHVRHAYDWLAPGGELVAVLPMEHPSRIKKRRQFSEWLDSIGAGRHPNPPKSFTSSDLPRQRLRYRYCAISTHLIHLCR